MASVDFELSSLSPAWHAFQFEWCALTPTRVRQYGDSGPVFLVLPTAVVDHEGGQSAPFAWPHSDPELPEDRDMPWRHIDVVNPCEESTWNQKQKQPKKPWLRPPGAVRPHSRLTDFFCSSSNSALSVAGCSLLHCPPGTWCTFVAGAGWCCTPCTPAQFTLNKGLLLPCPGQQPQNWTG